MDDHTRLPDGVARRRQRGERLTRPVFRAACLAAALGAAAAGAFTPEELHRDWPASRFVPTAAPCLRHAELVTRLGLLAAEHGGALTLEQLGESAQGRSIHLLTLGRGPRKVLLWSQMHGDEPSATPALLDLADFLLSRAAEDADAARILDQLTLLVVPMLNPDGAEAYARENAQAIDVNRDALNLSTPEGGLLKRLRDAHQPILGFNLHDQNRRRTAGDSGVLATNAVLAVSGDRENTLTPGRLRAQRACVAIADALGRFFPGGMARYDDDFNPRAFGDNITAWGTPVVLIESGGVPAPHPLGELTRLNFVALLTALRDLARNDLADWDAGRYEEIPDNALGGWVDVLVRGAEIRQPGTAAAYRADLPFDLLRSDLDVAGCAQRGRPARSEIREIGDGRLLAAGRTLDAAGRWIVAPFVVGVEGWSKRRWLDDDALRHLAGLGVAEVRWQVAPRHVGPAQAHTRAFAGPGRARVSVVSGELGASLLRLRAAPVAIPSPTLGKVIAALAGPREARGLMAQGLDAALTRLWGEPDPKTSRPVLITDRPASFSILAPAPSGAFDFDAELHSTWIDGLESRP